MMRLSAFTRGLADRRGNSTIELALVMPFSALLLAGTVDFATGFASKLGLEQAATRTVQQAFIQGRGTGATDFAYVQQAGADASGQPVANVTVDNWLECDGVRQTSTAVQCTSTQTSAEFLSVRIQKPFTATFDLNKVGAAFGSPGIMPTTLVGSARVRVA